MGIIDKFKSTFTQHEHLEEAQMSYKAHLDHAFMQSNRLLIMAIKSYIHGIFPGMYSGAGPLGIYRIYKEIRRMHHVQKMFKQDDENN